MFGWFTSQERLVQESNEVYMARAVADRALLQAAVDSPDPVFIASYFPASLARISERIPQEVPKLSRPWPDVGQPPRLALLDLNGLTLDTSFSSWLLRSARSFRFLCVEHFPGTSEEQALLRMLEELSTPNPQSIRFYVGMDDPMMQAFGSEKTLSLMRQLGMADDEMISHSMVDKSILTAQKKLQSRIPNPSRAQSDLEWFQLNYPTFSK